MATRDYIPVTGDDWYQRRREDAEGRFYRQVADQGPRKGAGGSTRQGIYMFTASGKLLAYKNAGQAPDVMRDVLKQALRKWNQLPKAERKPGAIAIDKQPKEDARYFRRPPARGLVVDVFTRILDHDAKEGLCRGTCDTPGGERAARDHLWLTESEWRSLISSDAKPGAKKNVLASIVQRIARFHLTDNTRGEPSLWRPDEVRSATMTLTVESSDSDRTRLRVDGSVSLATDADIAHAKRGFQARLLGYIDYNATAKSITRFDLVAIGDHWGGGTFTGKPRPGRTPLGIAFALAAKDAPDRLVPPQGAREIGDYMRGTK